MTDRRSFLSAGAALLGLSWPDQLRLATDITEEQIQQFHDDEPNEFPRRYEQTGLSGAFISEEYSSDTSLCVDVYPQQEDGAISIDIEAGGITLGTQHSVTDARELADYLEQAADDVEEWREKTWPEHKREGNDD
ncbi:hypothetical protein [Natronoarchaeum rubrum]|uniref:hypothetical protein n=1 Tax=Natronoarchaeum rubrum TaxID=755311 RepID=UPI002111FDDF|nr:hypothetical protein [Natronoarchaeum rubrum]